VRPRNLVAFRRERLATPDGDELWLDHVDGPPGAPRAVLLHGLEGSSHSVYIQGLAMALRRRGWSVTALNFRSCARDVADTRTMLQNLMPRLYHSGETQDIGHVLRTLSSRDGATKFYAAGVSLGGNVLLKWLGENGSGSGGGSGAASLVEAAATISVPYDLEAGARFMEKGLGPYYVEIFLETLRKKAVDLVRRFPEARIDIPRTLSAKSFFDFDDAATAPLHGFAGAEDYYRRSSSLSFLPQIAVPTLCISSEDDPFLPASVLPRARLLASPRVELIVTPGGGHVGFVRGPVPWRPVYWADELVAAWLTERAGLRAP
jgi:predicted alpha/beta-fold hydrolase